MWRSCAHSVVAIIGALRDGDNVLHESFLHISWRRMTPRQQARDLAAASVAGGCAPSLSSQEGRLRPNCPSAAIHSQLFMGKVTSDFQTVILTEGRFAASPVGLLAKGGPWGSSHMPRG